MKKRLPSFFKGSHLLAMDIFIIALFKIFTSFQNWGAISYVYQIGNSAKKLHSSETSFILCLLGFVYDRHYFIRH
ncbi:MAG: hypothetical protein ACP5IN_07935 [Caldimicrobium sp.]